MTAVLLEDPMATMADVQASIVGDPVVQDFARRIAPLYRLPDGSFSADAWANLFRPLPRVRTVEDVVGERGFVALHLLSFVANIPAARDHSQAWVWLAQQIWEAVPYLWMTSMRVAAEACPVPPHVVSANVLPFERMWWTFDEPEEDGVRDLTGLLVCAKGDAVQVVSVGRRTDNDDPRPTMEARALKYGARWPDDVEEADRPDLGRALALLSFLNSPHIPTTSRRMSGPLRRSLERQGWRERQEDAVRFVDLRGPNEWGGHSDRVEQGREHDFRWLVRGHHRAQWYPSESAHRVIWIAPYIKGPEGKPLRPPTYRVVR